MAEMSRYCRAYLVKDFRAFAHWNEDVSALAPADDGSGEQLPRHELKDDDILYLQENYVVTDGIFKDEHVVFAGDGEPWRNFCRTVLSFEIPSWVTDDAAGEPAPSEEVSHGLLG